LHEPFLQNWNIDIGPVRFDFSTNGKKKFRARLLPETIVSVILAAQTAKFNVGRTLATGNLVFVSKQPYVLYRGSYDLGYSFGRAVALSAIGNAYHEVIAHEIVHQFQFGDFQVFNTWLKPLTPKSKRINTIFSKYVYFNLPYFWGAYEIAGRYAAPHYFRNFFEFEAQRFATDRYVNR
jgi:hypothetical protein